ncbi:unnamed protein product [Jaminaea pallidilutea]
MTNHTLNSFRDTPLLNPDDSRDCTFCRIVDGSSPAHIVYSSPHTVAFLDILPIRAGHTLVIAREHVGDLAKLSHGEGEVMRDLVKVVRGLGAALGDDRLQVITNQVYAQVVPHLHFHIVPAPPIPGSSSSSSNTSSQRKSNPSSSSSSSSLLAAIGHGREELDDDEGRAMADKIRDAIAAAAAAGGGEEATQPQGGSDVRGKGKL